MLVAPLILLLLSAFSGITAARNEYDDAGRLIAQVDAAGNTNTFVHDLDARAEIIRDRLGNVTIHEYDGNGNITRSIDALNNVTWMTYDGNDNLLTKIDALGNTNRFTYDARDNKLTETDPLGNTTAYTYNAFNQPTSIRNARGFTTTNLYDASGNLTATIDALGQRTEFTYDAQGNVLQRIDPLGHVIDNAYDATGRATNMVVRDVQKGALRATQIVYDANGNKRAITRSKPSSPNMQAKSLRKSGDTTTEIVSVTYLYDVDEGDRASGFVAPDGSFGQVEFNGIGKISAFIDQLQRRTEFDYDERGNLSLVRFPDATLERYGYDAESRLLFFQDRGGRTTHFTNDALGRLVSMTYADGRSSHTAYDAIHRVVAEMDERGFVTRYEYDPNCGCSGRQTRIIDPLTNVTSYAYDANGNATSMTDANGRVTLYEYDALDRLARTVFEDGTAETNLFDANDREIARIDQEGRATYFAYDGLDRLTEVTNAVGDVTGFTYDFRDSLLSHADAEQRITTYVHDLLGRRLRRTLPLGQVERYRYDAVGNVTNVIDFNGRTTRYAYDVIDRLVEKVPDAAFAQPSVSFTYTATDQRETMTDASGTTFYSYNERDWLTNKATPQGTLAYQRDAVGNVTRIRSLNVNGVDLAYEFDALNRLQAVVDAHAGRTSFEFDGVSNLQQYRYANGALTTNRFDALHRLTNLTTHLPQPADAKEYRYTLNKAGQCTAVQEPSRRTVVYGFDALARLTSETVVGADSSTLNVNYTYDKVGNRQTRNAQTSAYDANDRLLGPLYDENGNTTNAVLFDPWMLQLTGVTDYYDYEDRLAARSPAFAGNQV